VNLDTDGAMPKDERTNIRDWKGIIDERRPYSVKRSILAVKSV